MGILSSLSFVFVKDRLSCAAHKVSPEDMLFTDFSEGVPFPAPKIFCSTFHRLHSYYEISAAESDLHPFILSLYKGRVEHSCFSFFN